MLTTCTTIPELRGHLDAARAERSDGRVRADDGLPPRRPRVADGRRPRRPPTWWWRRSSSTRSSSARPRTSRAYPRDLEGDSAVAEPRGRRPAVRAVGRGDVPGGRRAHDRLGRRGVGASGRPLTTDALRRRRHRGRQAVRHRRAVRGVLRGEGLPAARRDPADGARPLDPGRGGGRARRSGSPTGWPCRAATRTSRPRSGPRRRWCTPRCKPAAPTSTPASETPPRSGASWPTSSSAQPLAELDYAEVVDARTLQVVDPLAGELRLLAAVRFGKARLIDNLAARA